MANICTKPKLDIIFSRVSNVHLLTIKCVKVFSLQFWRMQFVIGVSRKPKHRSHDAYIADVNVNNDAMFVLLQFFLYTTHRQA